MSVLAGIGMLGVAVIASRRTPERRFSQGEKALHRHLNDLNAYLHSAGEGKRACVAVSRSLESALVQTEKAISAIEDGALGNDEFFRDTSELQRLKVMAERHCVRDIAVERDLLRIAMNRGKVLGGLNGATKVCMEYKRYNPSGKIRCSRWTSGPGYLPGPQSEESYRIDRVRKAYAEKLCVDPKNRKKCGLSRNYHYRGSLPYLPREKGGMTQKIMPVGKEGAVRIIRMGPANPLDESDESTLTLP